MIDKTRAAGKGDGWRDMKGRHNPPGTVARFSWDDYPDTELTGWKQAGDRVILARQFPAAALAWVAETTAENGLPAIQPDGR